MAIPAAPENAFVRRWLHSAFCAPRHQPRVQALNVVEEQVRIVGDLHLVKGRVPGEVAAQLLRDTALSDNDLVPGKYEGEEGRSRRRAALVGQCATAARQASRRTTALRSGVRRRSLAPAVHPLTCLLPLPLLTTSSRRPNLPQAASSSGSAPSTCAPSCAAITASAAWSS